jgi:hypothetical protein
MKDGVDVYLYKEEDPDRVYPVNILHWWPTRKEFQFPDALPPRMKQLIRRAKRSGSVLVTYAWAVTPDGTFDGRARCMEIDEEKASQRWGINRSVGLAVQEALVAGYKFCYGKDLPEPKRGQPQ